jgi:dTDP-4-amino-4,6-dideoxygalactose transaminase
MAVPLVDLRAQYVSIRDEIDAAIRRVLENTAFVLGPEVAAFESEFSEFCDVAECVACANGTDAIVLALQALGIGPGDEVITVPHTFIATAEAVELVGAIPVFVDVREDTLLMDVARVERAITPRTRAVIPVHLYGQTVDMDPLLEIAHASGLKVVEDAAQAHGARYKGRRAGTVGDAGTFSFYPGKNLGAYGDAGAVVTPDPALAAWLRRARDHGRASKYEHDFSSRSSRMDGLQAAVLRAKLPHLEGWNRQRRLLAARYSKRLEGSGCVPVSVAESCESACHLFVVRAEGREALRKRLADAGFSTGVHYPRPLHLQAAFARLGYQRGDFPITEKAAEQVLSLPLYPEMDASAIDRIAEVARG